MNFISYKVVLSDNLEVRIVDPYPTTDTHQRRPMKLIEPSSPIDRINLEEFQKVKNRLKDLPQKGYFTFKEESGPSTDEGRTSRKDSILKSYNPKKFIQKRDNGKQETFSQSIERTISITNRSNESSYICSLDLTTKLNGGGPVQISFMDQIDYRREVSVEDQEVLSRAKRAFMENWLGLS